MKVTHLLIIHIPKYQTINNIFNMSDIEFRSRSLKPVLHKSTCGSLGYDRFTPLAVILTNALKNTYPKSVHSCVYFYYYKLILYDGNLE